MNCFLRGVARAIAETFDLPEPILEVGSYLVEGQQHLADLRSLFPGKEYVGLDIRPGPGVDCVGSVEALPLVDSSVGTVLALSTFEHVAHFWRGFEEVRRVLRPDGALVVSCPFYFYVHSYPNDYWRFTPEALRVLLRDYPGRIVGWHGPARRPLNVWAVAFREAHPPVTAAQFARYRDLLGRYAHEPLSWRRRLRYRLGRWLCGRGPFAPYLEQDSWETECQPPPAPPACDRPRRRHFPAAPPAPARRAGAEAREGLPT
jgi:SAM-dependent methyltransferase